MKSTDIRRKFINFYKNRGHKEIPSANLVPENDSTTLFTSSGMQPLVPYLLGEKHPLGTRLVNSQKAFRAQDIEEVGDNRHTTFFEMLGNWSFGDYFKKEQLYWIFEFLTKELGLNPKRLYVSIFEGNEFVPKDAESVKLWKDIFSTVGIDAQEGIRIFPYTAKKNWWSRSGEPDKMPSGEPGGPDSEVFFDFGEELKLHEKSQWKNEKCHPNCDCGRFMEIANSVFMQYRKKTDGTLEELPNKNVDFGGGLERLVSATNNNPDVFQTDFFSDAVISLENIRKSGDSYKDNPKPYRVILDHLRAAIFMVNDGVRPSNKAQGYILRRLLRRSMVYARELGMSGDEWLSNSSTQLIMPYRDQYPYIIEHDPEVNEIITSEVDKFRKTIDKGLSELKKIVHEPGWLPYGKSAAEKGFYLYQSFGLPIEVFVEEIEKIHSTRTCGKDYQSDIINEFNKLFEDHAGLSRTASKGMFKGGLADHSEQVTKLHTATHLLHQVLRMALGTHVAQKGSNITADRLRFDFVHPQKVTPEELQRIESLVNEQIQKNLPVSYRTTTYKEAITDGALAFFGERYPEQVKVYTIGDFSKEICGGPHVEKTGVIGTFRIIKEESVSSGIRRIYATVSSSPLYR